MIEPPTEESGGVCGHDEVPHILMRCACKKCCALCNGGSACWLPATRSGSQPAKSSVAGCQPQGLAASLLSQLWLAASRKVWQPGQKSFLSCLWLAASHKVWQPGQKSCLFSLCVVDCGFCMLCPCRKADDPPEQTMDPLPTLPDLKRLVFVKDCVCVLMCMYV